MRACAGLPILRTQKPRLQSEIDAVNAQIDYQKKQLGFTKQQSEQYDAVVKKGLGRSYTQFDLLRNEARHEGDLWRLTAELSRLKVNAGELDIKLQEIETAFKKQIMAELLEVRQRIKELDVLLPTAHQIREVKLQGGSTDELHLISIPRTRNGASTIVRVSETTPLEPGDIINVKRPVAAGSSVRSAFMNAHGISPHRTAPVASVGQIRVIAELPPAGLSVVAGSRLAGLGVASADAEPTVRKRADQRAEQPRSRPTLSPTQIPPTLGRSSAARSKRLE